MASETFQGEGNSQQQPIYQNINKSNRPNLNKYWSVYGESHYLATGIQSKGPWDPTSRIKGISSYPPETDIKLEDFLGNYEEILAAAISDNPVEKRNPDHVAFLLHTLFPHLETAIAKSGRTADILDIILKLSCVKQCSVVTRYALRMLLDTLTKTSYDSGGMYNDFLLKCESCLRDSLLDNTIFKYENVEDQGLRIFVYSRSMVMLYANVIQGTVPLGNIDGDFEALFVRLCDLEDQIFFVERDKPLYAIRCIKEMIARLSRFQRERKESKKSFYMFLKWLREYNSKVEENRDDRNESVKKFISQIKTSRKGWFDFHATIFCLGSQIYKKPKNREVLRALAESYIKHHSDRRSMWSREREWETGLVLGSVLEEIVNDNHDRDTRKLSCLCLIYCFKKLAKRKSPAKKWLHQSLRRCLYGPNRDLRAVILKHLEMGEEKKDRKDDIAREDMDENLPITQSMEYLVQRYKKQLLPNSLNSSKMTDLQGFFSATFRDEKAFVKVLLSTKVDFIREERIDPNKIPRQLIMEAYTLRRLNSKPHPNILRVFAYDTSAQPYHLITELVSEGSLLQFLRCLRTRPEHMPVPSVLLEMMFGILDALIYLDEQHFVHLAIMADNVLVSHDNVCKLTGFQFAKQMTRQGGGHNFAFVSLEEKMPIRHSAPECLESGYFSEHSVSWAVGIMLFEMHTYGVSPYNQYSNDQADQIRSHVIGRGELKRETCILSEVWEGIEMCFAFEKENRPSLLQLKMELERIHNQIIEEEKDWPAADTYPALTNVDNAQTKDGMMSSTELEELDKEKNLGDFGSETTSIDRPTIRNFDGDKKIIRELVLKTTEENLQKLKYLKHKNVVEVLSLSDHDKKHVALVTEYSGLSNLLQAVLTDKYRPDQLVNFAAQIAQGLCYLHKNNMIHGDLRAEHIMLFPNNEVKVSRLGRSKSRELLGTHCSMPEDAVRWSPLELIKHDIYSRCSDVYSYGLLCYELFEALEEGNKIEDVKPFAGIEDNKILEHLQGNNRPGKPKHMPVWVNIIARQCLLDKPNERPAFAVIEDALTSRKPFDSHLLSHMINSKQIQGDIVDIHVTQPEEASHVIAKEHHKTFEELSKIVYDEIKDLEDPYEEIAEASISREPMTRSRPRPLPRKPIQESDPSFSESFALETKNTNWEPSDPPYENVNQSVYDTLPASTTRNQNEDGIPPPPPKPAPPTTTTTKPTPPPPPPPPPILDNKAEKSSGFSLTLPASTTRNQQNMDEDYINSYSSSDESYIAAEVSPDRMTDIPESVHDNVQNVHELEDVGTGGEPVESSWQFTLPRPENRGQDYVSMAGYDTGNIECSWRPLTPQNGQRDGGSLSEASSVGSTDLGATECSWYSLPPQDDHRNKSSSPQPGDTSEIEDRTSRLAGKNQLGFRPVPVPRAKARKHSESQK